MFTRTIYRLALGAALALACASGFAQTLTTIKIANLPAAGLLNGTELFPAEQSGHTVVASTSQIETLMASNANTWTAAQIFGGTTTFNAASSFTSSVLIGSPTGGPKGAGTVNASAIYSNGVQLQPGISSLSLTVPAWETISSPCGAGACALNITSASLSANCVLASPNGSSGALSCRNLLAADLPTYPASQLSGVVTAGQGGSGVAGTLSGPLEANGTGAYTIATGAQLAAQFSGAAATCWLLGNGSCTDVVSNAIASTGGTYAGSTGAITMAMGSTGGAANGFALWDGWNAWWNGTNWLTGTDGNNGAALITSSETNGNLNFYTIPSTGAGAQAISNSSLSSFNRLSLTNSAAAFTVPVTAPSFSGGSASLTSLNATGLAGFTGDAALPSATTSGAFPGTFAGFGNLQLIAGGAAADNRRWQLVTSSNSFAIVASLDNLTSGTGLLTAVRSGASIGAVTLNGTSYQFNTGAITAPGITSSNGLTVTNGNTTLAGPTTVTNSLNVTGFTTLQAGLSVGGAACGTTCIAATSVVVGNLPNEGVGTVNANGLFQNNVPVQNLPVLINAQTANYVLQASDCGKAIVLSGASGQSVTVPSSVVPAGCTVVLLAFSGTNTYTVVQGTSESLYWAGNGVTTGNRTLSSVAQATIFIVNGSQAVISGSGIT